MENWDAAALWDKRPISEQLVLWRGIKKVPGEEVGGRFMYWKRSERALAFERLGAAAWLSIGSIINSNMRTWGCRGRF